MLDIPIKENWLKEKDIVTLKEKTKLLIENNLQFIFENV